MAEKQKFLLGVGCQKAGTTWLWDYLAGFETVALPSPKELHIFDTMLRPEYYAHFAHVAKNKAQEMGLLTRIKAGMGKHRRGWLRPQHRLEMIADPQKYVDFFRDLDPSADLIGEITPSYSSLDTQDLSFIRDLLEPYFDIHVILLLRDPVQRAFSGARHFKRVNRDDFPVALNIDDNAYFEKIMTSPYITERQDYERILRALDAVFDPTRVHVEFYERLFSDEAVARITTFLGLPQRIADFGKRVNSAPKKEALDPQLARRARQVYAPTYDYCATRFGPELIGELWS